MVVEAIARGSERRLLLRYAAVTLAVLGGVEWLLGRTVSRMAASPALDGTPRAIIEGLGRVGIFVLPLAFIAAMSLLLLAALGHGEIATRTQNQQGVAFAMYLSLFATLTIAAPFFPPTSWFSTSYNIMSLIALTWGSVYALSNHSLERWARIAIGSTILAYLGWFYYVLVQEVGARWGWSGEPVLALNLGEILAIATPLLFFAAIALPGDQWMRPRRWIAPVAIALLFAAGNVADMAADQGFTGVFTLWSVGFTHFLPWPLYAVALAAYIYSLLTCFSRDEYKTSFANPNTGLGMLLLVFAGYNLQLTYQHLLALLAILLLGGIVRPFSLPVEATRDAEVATTI